MFLPLQQGEWFELSNNLTIALTSSNRDLEWELWEDLARFVGSFNLILWFSLQQNGITYLVIVLTSCLELEFLTNKRDFSKVILLFYGKQSTWTTYF